MPQLDPTWFASQLFWLFIAFAALYFILARKILPPLQGILAQREQTISSDLDQAQSSKNQAEKAREEYERTLAEARSRAQQLINEAALAQKAKAEQAGKDMDQQVSKKLAEAEQKIQAKKRELMDALTPVTAELAGMIVEKLTQRAPTNDKVNAVIGELLKSRSGQR